MKTVMITGCSSGYGLEISRYFLSNGWNVVATMRTPRAEILKSSGNLRVIKLDVTKPASISLAIKEAGPIDVLVNNAGVGAIGAFEATPIGVARHMFETNTLGMMAMTQAVLPMFRKQKSGVIVNISSSVALAPMPLSAIYTATKVATEGFTEVLALELADFNIRMKLVQPGYTPTTSLLSNAAFETARAIPEPYAPFALRTFAELGKLTLTTKESDVAEVVFRAANDTSRQLRFPAGLDALALAQSRLSNGVGASVDK